MSAAHLQARSPRSTSSQSPDEIERDIEETRRALNRTLEDLQAKLSPRRRLEVALSSARQGGGRLAAGIGQAARHYPVPFVLIGASLLVAIVAGPLMIRRRR